MKNWPAHHKLTATLVILLFMLLTILLLCSCATQRSAEKYYSAHPDALAKKCADVFPVKDTITLLRDSVHLDTIVREHYLFDTLYVEGLPKVTKRPCPPSETITKQVYTDRFHYLRDRAFERAQRDSIEALQRDNSKLIGEKLQLEKQAQGSRKWLWWFIALVVVLIGAGAWRVLKVLKPTVNIKT